MGRSIVTIPDRKINRCLGMTDMPLCGISRLLRRAAGGPRIQDPGESRGRLSILAVLIFLRGEAVQLTDLIVGQPSQVLAKVAEPDRRSPPRPHLSLLDVW